jgi:hypothetical protein
MKDPYLMVFINVLSAIVLSLIVIVYRFVYPKKGINLFYLLLAISVLPVISIFRAGTYQASDLTIHTVFLQSFFENIKAGIFIPRWAAGLCGGYGCPEFILEYTMPFYIGSFFHFLGFSFLNSMKLFLASSFIVSGITMYYFVKDELGEKAAFISSLLYIFAPIHLMETHFRVSVGTVAAFMFIPLAFLFAKKALGGKKSYIILYAVNFLFLILSHACIGIVVLPASLIYAFIKKQETKQMIFPLFAFLLGLGLASFYALPAIAEIKYTWNGIATIIGDSGFFPILYYIYSPVDFGLLFQGHQGELRLIVGYAQLGIVGASIYYLIKNKFEKVNRHVVFFLLLMFTACFTLMLSFTKPLWNSIIFLKAFILPWRLLVPISFFLAFLGGIVTRNWKKPALIIFSCFIIGSTILNWANRSMSNLPPDAYYTQVSMYTEYFEPNNPIYLARYNQRLPQIDKLVLQRSITPLQILSGNGAVKETKRTPIDHQYIVYANTNVDLSENTYYFPGWKIYVDGKTTNIDIKNPKKFGTLTFNLPQGLHTIEAKFEDSPTRAIADYISLFSLIVIALIICSPIMKRL